MLLGIVVALGGCDMFHKDYTTKELPDGYINLTVENEIAHLSFDYPAYLDLVEPVIVDQAIHYFTYLQLLAPWKSEIAFFPDPAGNKSEYTSVQYVPAGITIIIDDLSKETSHYTASIYLENSAGNKDNDRSDNYELLGRSQVTVSGVTGEMIVYEIDRGG